MTRWMAYTIISITLFVLLLSVFLVSPLATPLMRWTINHHVDGINVNQLSGSLLSGLNFSNVQFNNDQLDLSVERISVNLDWHCITFSDVCFEYINIFKPALIINQDQQQAPDSEEKESGAINLPVRIVIRQLSIQQSAAQIGPLEVMLNSFTTRVSVQNSVKLDTVRIEQVGIVNNSPIAPRKPFRGIQYQVPDLPEISLPLPIQINEFHASGLTYQTLSETNALQSVSLSRIDAQGSLFDWSQLAIIHAKGQLTSDGQVSLAEDYAINLTVTAEGRLDADTSQLLDAQLTGSLADLQASVTLAGLVNGDAELMLNALSEDLPVQGRLNWPAQTVNYQTIQTLKPGELIVEGDIGRYGMRLETGFTQGQLGDIDVTTEFNLTKTSFEVSQLDAQLLGGSITNRGSIHFVNDVSGEGYTEISDINLTPVLQNEENQAAWQVMSVPQASWQYIISQRPNGIELLMSDIEASIDQAGKQATVTGQAVYSQGNDLGVASLNLTQVDGNNTLGLTAQVLNQRFINAEMNMKMTSLEELVTGVQGNIDGTAKIVGEWKNPSFDADINFQNILVSPDISVFAANKGALSASIQSKGRVEQHTIQLNAGIDEAKVALNIDGKWSQDSWYSTFRTAAIDVKNTRWNLDREFDMTLAAKSLAIDIGEHCWLLADDPARACIGKAKYADSGADWQFELNNLPIGEWSKPYLVALEETSDSARLNINGEGSLDDNNDLFVEASAYVNSSVWTFNDTHPVDISLQKLAANLSLANDILKTNIDLVSPELGKASGTAQVNILDPMTQDNNVELSLDRILLAPFAQLSPSVFDLAGMLNGKLTLTGALQRPAINGSLSLSDASVEIEQSPLAIANWQQQIDFSGTQAIIDGSFSLGEGAGSLSGQIDWEDKPFINLLFDADDIALSHESSKLTVSPSLTSLITTDEVKVSGSVDIPYARINIDSLPENAISPSNDVYLRGEPPDTDPLKRIDADILITLDNAKSGEVKLDAFGLTANLHGGLQIKNQPSVVGYGDLQILNGRYKAYGQNLIIRTGEVQFNGPLSQPFLFVEAIRNPEMTDDDVIAGVRIDGPASAATVSLFSEPAMDQNQNLLYLLNGSGNLNESGAAGDDKTYATALLGFGLASSGALTSGVGDALGIEDFSLSTTGQGEQAKIAISGRIADNLTLRYGVGVFDNEPEVALRYQIMPKLYIEAISAASEAVDIYYQFSVGKLEPEQEGGEIPPH